MRNAIRIGVVSSVNEQKASARVAFFDQDDMVSDELPILYLPTGAQTYAVPKVGDSVVCAFSGNDGFVVGTYYGESDAVPSSNNQLGVWHEDGSYVYFDRSSGTLNVKAAGGVKIEGDLLVTGSITRAGEKL
ncbi:phage baseplate assembly protein V [Paenibacillus alvei]|uniref:phage baseplate assembly protein V n=1 Tax=Paenibacillus alvei TaxID=44250 RepID=UPI00228177C2|nr:phage baseplate assembly protein V [Paenibacillus alvei]MCY7486422.1 phage baseplate assembly protein V [Paenibacillus alvei]